MPLTWTVVPMSVRRVRLDVGVQDDVVETLRLPLSGLLYQRRQDGRWRCVLPAQYDDEEAGRFEPDPDDWVPADLPIASGGRAQRAPGAREEASWWLLYGDTRNGPVTVTLTDGRTPPILTFGPLWICEWVSAWQTALVTVGSDSHQAFHHIPRWIRTRGTED